MTCVIIRALESKGLNLKLPIALVLNYPVLDFNFTSWMSKDHLKVLRAEDTSGYLSSGGRIDDMRVAEHEDYMHFNTLSMVGSDGRESRLGRSSSSTSSTRRNRSWVATLKDFAAGADNPRKLKLRRSTQSLVTAPQQTLGLTPREVDSKPSRPRRAFSISRTLPKGQSSVTVTSRGGKLSTKGEGGERADACGPQNTAAARAHPLETRSGGPFDNQGENNEASIGRGRLTMTSRTGYFQDRIIPPSMVGSFGSHHQGFGSLTFVAQMRAMAILYLSNRNPDFSTDYQVSPIMTPCEVLARFPRVLMQCGEKDPFVDDTIIFAGRLRESKRARLRELSARMEKREFSESEAEEWARLDTENEEDWVEVALFPEWSHGFLQMGRLMKGATAVIDDIGVWIGKVFEGNKATGAFQSGHSHKPNTGGGWTPSDARSEADSGIGSPSALSPSSPAALPGNSSASHQQQLLKTITEGELIRRRRLLAAR